MWVSCYDKGHTSTLVFAALGASCPVHDFTRSEVTAGAPRSRLLARLLSTAPAVAAVISLAPSVDWYFVEGFVWIPSKNSAYLVKRKESNWSIPILVHSPRPQFPPTHPLVEIVLQLWNRIGLLGFTIQFQPKIAPPRMLTILIVVRNKTVD